MGYLFALGFISILGQVVLLRELSVAFFGVDLVYTLAVGVWLLSTACGSMVKGRTYRSPSLPLISCFFVLFSIWLPLDVAFIRSARLLFADVPGAYLPLHTQFAVMCISLLPTGLILGLLFQWTAKASIAGGRSLALAYAIESIGGIAGGICGTLFLKFGYQNFVIALICTLSAIGASFLSFDGHSVNRRLHAISLIFFALFMLILWKAPQIDRRMTSWTHPNLIETLDCPYSRVTVTYSEGQVSVFENDALLFDTEGTRAEEFVQLAALQHPHPARVLVLGGGIAGTVREILLHSPQTVDYVELNPALLRVVPRNLPLEIQKSLRAQNVRIIASDPRQFLDRALAYDLILVGMPEPGSGQANRFYTQEFFRQCRSKLNKNGIMAFSLQSSENILTPQLTRRMVSIYRAAKSVFPEVLVLPGASNIVISTNGRLDRDWSVISGRLEARGIKGRIVSRNYIRYLYTNDRNEDVARALESGRAPINTDVRPICYQYTIMIWLSKFLPSFGLLDFSLPVFRRGSIVWLVLVSLPALLLSNARWPVRRTILMGIAGFAGMATETIILLYFQTKNGILFQDIGILLTGFMAGLALGALAAEKMRGRPSKLVGLAILGGFVLLSAAIGWCIDSGKGSGLAVTFVFLVLAGFLVGGVFGYGSLRETDDQTRAITPLYAADLIGGCLGSLIATLALAPIAGLAATSYLMIPLLMLSALLV